MVASIADGSFQGREGEFGVSTVTDGPRDNATAVSIHDHGQKLPAPILHLDIGDVSHPQLIRTI